MNHPVRAQRVWRAVHLEMVERNGGRQLDLVVANHDFHCPVKRHKKCRCEFTVVRRHENVATPM